MKGATTIIIEREIGDKIYKIGHRILDSEIESSQLGEERFLHLAWLHVRRKMDRATEQEYLDPDRESGR